MLNIDHVMCTLHPLNMALPLGDIKKLKLTGLIYLAALHPSTAGLGERKKFCVPVKHHHFLKQSTMELSRHDYGIILESDAAPVKIYYDTELSSEDVSSNYGTILNDAIPALVEITQRFIPSAPFVDQRYKVPKDVSPPLSPWDNMRHQFHGKFSWKVKKVSFRWLLDTIRNYNWSIQLTSKDFHFYHSTGIFGLTLSDSIITIPSLSYHLINFKENSLEFGSFAKTMRSQTGEGRFKRHSLLSLPLLDVKFRFFWRVPFAEVNHSSRHHTPFLFEPDGWPRSICPNDRFTHFRSQGVKMHFEIQLDKSEQLSTLIALRADVLPWITHQLSIVQGENDSEENEEEELCIDGVQVNVNANDLNIVAWFDERAEFIADDNTNSDQKVEGLYVTIPCVSYILDRLGRNRIDIDGVQAALLDIDCNDFSSPLTSRRYAQRWTSVQWMSHQHPCEYEESNNLNSFRTFASLHNTSQELDVLDYLLIVKQINILDKSLEEILNNGDLGFSSYSSSDAGAQQKAAPWTVLVAEMKLLWTLKIRDRVLQIVKDILYNINFMIVNIRGTPQSLGESDTEIDEESDPYVEPSLTTPKHSGTDSITITLNDMPMQASMAKDYLEGESTSTNPRSPQRITSSEKVETKFSYLDHLLNETSDHSAPKENSFHNMEKKETTESSKIMLNSSVEKSDVSSESSSSEKRDATETTPTFDLHLSNPQIQFHSEKTGGSVIISMLGAYIQSKMYLHLFCKEENFGAEDFRVETLLRRTEFLYTLNRMELHSLSNSVDLELGLQWLETTKVQKDLWEDEPESLRSRELMQFQKNHCKNDNRFDRYARSFPLDLLAHETKDFTLPPFCQKIMDPCNFTTTQTFHRPPIDLTKEELEEIIKMKSICSLTTTDQDNRKFSRAIDHVALNIDELSFLLDSYQFSTTLDVIRNVLLEPQQPARERFYNLNESKSEPEEAKAKTPKKSLDGKSEACSNMEEAIRQWDQQAYQKSKKGREYLRSIANDLLAEVDDKGRSEEPSVRRIEYKLFKAKWRIAGQDSINDAVVSFTGFKGVHDFTADGSVNSQITLEDFNVESKTPGNESMEFEDSTIIIKTFTGVKGPHNTKRGLIFDRANSETHTNKLHAVAIRMDAFPRTAEGLTMYKHIEANVFPGVSHSIKVQLTKSLTKSFISYFLGDGNNNGEFIDQDIDSTSECATPQNRRRAESDSSSDCLEVSYHSNSETSRTSQNTDGKEKVRRKMLFGIMSNRRKKENNNTSSTKKNKNKKRRNEDSQNETTSALSTKSSKEDGINKKEEAKQHGEIVFVKYWRVGSININLSVAGFGKIIRLENQDVLVPSFLKAYKIGASNHLIWKLVKHFGGSLAKNSLDIIRNKLGGTNKNQKFGANDDFDIGFSNGVLSDLDEGGESQEDESALNVLTASSLVRSRNNTVTGRKRLYTK